MVLRRSRRHRGGELRRVRECVPRQLRVLCLRVQRELRPLERRAAKPSGGLQQPASRRGEPLPQAGRVRVP
jgi:hypothetical protein